MSESMPESSGGRSTVFTRRIGPLPMWGWMAIVLLLALGVYLVRSEKAKSAAASSSTGTGSSSGSTSVDSPGGVDASLVPQFVNQTYVQPTPPPAPNLTINNTTTDTGTTGTGSSGTATASVHQYPQPSGLTTSKVSPTSLKATWNDISSPSPSPKSYTLAVYDGSKIVSQQTVNAPDTTGGKSTATVTGLPANAKNLSVHVWANGGAVAPQHASSTVSL